MSDDSTSTTRRTALKFLSGATVGAAGIGSVSGAGTRFADREYDEDVSEWVLRLGSSPDLSPNAVDAQQIQSRVAQAQEPVVSRLSAKEGVDVRQRTWIANAILVETETATPQGLVAIEGVKDVHPNFTFESPNPVENQQLVALPEANNPTYGLSQIDARRTWEQYETQGEGVRVAVLDTGIDDSHPDLELTEGGWAQFDAEGNQLDTKPNDPNGHGTHVSGTIAGGAASGLNIGVAPGAELLNAKVLDNGGTFTQIIAGIQWAAEQDADVINMSLGAIGYFGVMIEPVRNAQAVGTLIVSSSGNSGADTSGSPANVYDTIAVGATDPARTVAGFSSGERIHTSTAWEGEDSQVDPPEEWPTWYTIPDLTAPGANVLSAYPGGNWQRLSGTSMASPHVVGVAALVKSVAPNLGPVALRQVLQRETVHPAGRRTRDTRYGLGIVNAFNATTSQEHGGLLTGTVTVDGEPASQVTVETAFGTTRVTNEKGQYRLTHPESTAMVAADTFGLSTGVSEIDVDGATEVNLILEQIVDVKISQGQPPDIAGGESFDIEFDVANLEQVTVTLGDDTTGVTADDISLSLNGEIFAPGDTLSFAEPLSTEGVVLSVTVNGAVDGAVLTLDHSFSGLGATRAPTTGPTTIRVTPEPASIQIVDPNFQQEVTPNGTLLFNPTLTNPGDLTASQTVEMLLEDVQTPDGVINQAFPVDVELGPGETSPVSLPIGFGDFPRQEATQRIVTADDEVSKKLYILNSEIITLSENMPATGTIGRDLVVEVTLRNDGEVAGTVPLSYSFDGVTVDQTEATVEAGSNTTVTLSTETDGLTPGQYPHTVARAGEPLVEAQVTLEKPELHESGVPIEIVEATLPNGADTTLSLVRDAVEDWADDRRIQGLPVTLEQLRIIIGWWAQNR